MSYWNSHNAGREQQAWLAYEKALLQGSADYSGVQMVAASDEFAGTRMQEWAYLAWADRQLRMAAEMFLVNRDAAKEKLSAIAAVYDQYSTDATDPEIRNRARLGLARVSEMQGRLDDARRQYGEVEGALGRSRRHGLRIWKRRTSKRRATGWRRRRCRSRRRRRARVCRGCDRTSALRFPRPTKALNRLTRRAPWRKFSAAAWATPRRALADTMEWMRERKLPRLTIRKEIALP
jgi:hypothetical protein